MTEEALVPVYHRGTGHVAFYTVGRLQAGDRVTASKVVLIEGEAQPGTLIRCGTCRQPLSTTRDMTYSKEAK